MAIEATARHFRTTEVGCAIVFGLLLVVAIGGYSLKQSERLLHTELNHDADRLLRGIYEQFGNVSGIVASLSALHQVVSTIAGDEMEIFAQGALEGSEVISSIGRFDKVATGEQGAFAEQMEERGIYRFSLTQLTDSGAVVKSEAREVYYPIVDLYPFNPALAKLVGVDITSTTALRQALLEAVHNNDSALTVYPMGWPRSGDVLIVHPTYLGRYVPSKAQQRESQSDGGYFVELYLTGVLDVLGEDSELNVEVWLQNDPTPQSKLTTEPLVSLTHEAKATRYLQRYFPGFKRQANPSVGISGVLVNIYAADGLPLSMIRSAVLNMLVSSLLLLVIFGLIRARRISERRSEAVELSLAREREIALTTLEAIGDAVVTADSNGKISYVNPATRKLLKKSDAELVGYEVTDAVVFAHEMDGQGHAGANLDKALRQGLEVEFPEVAVLDSRQNSIQVDSVLSPFGRSEPGQRRGSVLVMRDVSAERKLSRELEFQATHDSLTEISNRYIFERTLREMVASAVETGQQHAICYMDLDQFKIINDTCGHTAGDQLLVQVARRLQKQVRENDVIARLGGDEFGLLIRNCDEKQAIEIARRVHDSFQQFYYNQGDKVFAVRASIGFVHINGTYSSVEDVMTAADLACYSAKDRGRNELHVYQQGGQEIADRKGQMLLLPKIQNALRNNSFRLFVQPIAAIESDKLISNKRFEILLRLIEEDGSIVTPFQLILAAERYDLMREIDRWVISNSFRLIAQLRLEMDGYSLPSFAINLSGQSTVDPDLPGFISSQLAITGIDPKKLCFEITETSAIANMQDALELVAFLHDLGCSLALDDFGSGFSSFGYLKELPVDYLKIDGQFIKEIAHSDVDREMVRSIHTVAKLLGIDTIAEFVENDEIVAQLREIGITYAQGYHIGKSYDMQNLIDSHLKPAAA